MVEVGIHTYINIYANNTRKLFITIECQLMHINAAIKNRSPCDNNYSTVNSYLIHQYTKPGKWRFNGEQDISVVSEYFLIKYLSFTKAKMMTYSGRS
jgi:hypothetical protein